MFDIGFLEIVIIASIALVVLGPERLPRAARTAGMWVGRARRMVSDVKSDIDSYLNGGWNGVEGWEAISSIIGALGIQTDMDLMMEESE